MKLLELLTAKDAEIKQAYVERERIVERIQAACSHPKMEQEEFGYNYNDGYGGSCANHWIKQGIKCTACDKVLEDLRAKD